MKTLLNIIAALLTMAIALVVIPMALTGNLTFGLGVNAGHAPVNGFAIEAANVNKAPASIPDISQDTLGTAAAGSIPGIGSLNTIGNADIAAKIGAK